MDIGLMVHNLIIMFLPGWRYTVGRGMPGRGKLGCLRDVPYLRGNRKQEAGLDQGQARGYQVSKFLTHTIIPC